MAMAKIRKKSKGYNHSFIECSCGKKHCRVCSNQIENVCTQCGLPKDKLTTCCYGGQLSSSNDRAVKNGTLDFTEEGWVNLDKDGNPEKQHSEIGKYEKKYTRDSAEGIPSGSNLRPASEEIIDEAEEIAPPAGGYFVTVPSRGPTFLQEPQTEEVQETVVDMGVDMATCDEEEIDPIEEEMNADIAETEENTEVKWKPVFGDGDGARIARKKVLTYYGVPDGLVENTTVIKEKSSGNRKRKRSRRSSRRRKK